MHLHRFELHKYHFCYSTSSLQKPDLNPSLNVEHRDIYSEQLIRLDQVYAEGNGANKRSFKNRENITETNNHHYLIINETFYNIHRHAGFGHPRSEWLELQSRDRHKPRKHLYGEQEDKLS